VVDVDVVVVVIQYSRNFPALEESTSASLESRSVSPFSMSKASNLLTFSLEGLISTPSSSSLVAALLLFLPAAHWAKVVDDEKQFVVVVRVDVVEDEDTKKRRGFRAGSKS